jgi:fumarate reductase flavoprotein subunit
MKNNGMKSNMTSTSITRRSIFKGVGAAMFLAAMPWDVRKALARQQFDLIVIGGGTAGMPTAISAADRGAQVLIIEKASVLGGTMYLSEGQMAGANTVFQKRLGIDDSPDIFYDDIMRINKYTSDPALTRIWADNGGATINWLAEHGFTIRDGQPVLGRSHDFYRTARYLWGAENAMSIFKVMEPLLSQHIKEGNITVLLGAGAVDLIKDEKGAVRGVVTEDSNGKRSDFDGLNVVISSGGCAANPKMFENIHHVPLYGQNAYPFSQGAGLTLGLSAGGYLRGAEKYVSGMGSVVADGKIPSPRTVFLSLHPEIRPPWEVFVNARGERFMQEDHPSIGHRERALTLQPGHRFWVIFDQKILEQAPSLVLFPNWSRDKLLEAFNTHPMFTRAPSLSELGVVTGIHPANLDRSISKYNSAIEKSEPDQFSRVHRPVAVSSPPFYAIQSQGTTIVSFAGLAVNKDLQVITEENEPVSNLYAAGEVLGAGSTSGKAYTGGSTVTPALTFGRLLGQKIIQF